MTIRLYMDEDSMRHRLVQALRARGVDVVTALDVGMTEVPDENHLDWATMHGRVLYRGIAQNGRKDERASCTGEGASVCSTASSSACR